MDGEVWKDVPSFPRLWASNLGRLMLEPIQRQMPNGGTRTYGGTPTKGALQLAERRYVYTHGGKTHRVSRLVCEAFHGPPPFEKAVAMHKDEDSMNNRSDNLKWGTQKENLNAPGFLAYCHSRVGVNSSTAKGRAKF